MSQLHADSLAKFFCGKKILQDIFLSCKTSEIVGLLGKNGSGKSTLLQIIFGTVKGDSQYIKFNNKILLQQLHIKHRIVYLPQHSFLPNNVKIKTLLKLFCDEENCKKLKDLEVIKMFLVESPKNLSSDELSMLEILLIMFSKAEIILLDEPFAILSPKLVSQIKAIISELKAQKGFIISDHNYHDILDISDRNLLLVNGSLKNIQDLTDLKFHKYIR